jgi:uncharacterized protein (TIGR02246 family)
MSLEDDMKAFATVCLSLLLCVPIAIAQQAEEEEVRRAVNEYDNAIQHQDAAALARLYSDDYLRIGASGKLQNKAEAINGITNPRSKITHHEYSDLGIRTYGNAAAVTGISKSTREANGTSEEQEERFLQVWAKRNGVWQMTVQQRTSTKPIPASAY